MTDTGNEALTIRRASVADAPAVLGLFDEVIAWFVAIGNPQQWGSEAWSSIPRRITQVTDACALPGVRRVVYGKYPWAVPVRQLHGPEVCL